jgi:uncharacterized membrane protein
MPAFAIEWLNLLVRWIHVIAGIMWIGDSFLFMWMDSHLTPPSRPREGAVAGELWMVHSGGFYEVVKRRSLAAAEMPARLYWFKWQAYTTWLSGFALLAIVYWLGGAIYLLDRSVSNVGAGPAIALSLALLAIAWLIYDALWSSPLGRRPALATTISFALVIAAAWALGRVFSAHAAYVQIGAMLGTIMAANVAMRIIPAQKQMLAATRAGETVDVTLGARAKSRSTHNHYMTLPVVFIMLSGHFPGTYGHPLAWLVLALVIVVGVVAKRVMNFGLATNRLELAAGALALIGAVALTGRTPARSSVETARLAEAPRVSFAEAKAIIDLRCITCHSTHPSNPAFTAPPSGIVLEDPRRIHDLAPRILVRAVETRTMPLGNLTGMTQGERDTLGAWIAQGAKLDADGADAAGRKQAKP